MKNTEIDQLLSENQSLSSEIKQLSSKNAELQAEMAQNKLVNQEAMGKIEKLESRNREFELVKAQMEKLTVVLTNIRHVSFFHYLSYF